MPALRLRGVDDVSIQLRLGVLLKDLMRIWVCTVQLLADWVGVRIKSDEILRGFVYIQTCFYTIAMMQLFNWDNGLGQVDASRQYT